MRCTSALNCSSACPFTLPLVSMTSVTSTGSDSAGADVKSCATPLSCRMKSDEVRPRTGRLFMVTDTGHEHDLHTRADGRRRLLR